MKPFLYGTHYSTFASILYFLIRLEPFASLCLKLQSGKFDCPDRLFSSIIDSWQSCFTNSADLKELTPEFYSLPDFFININNFDFGKSQKSINDGIIDSVKIPEWASSPEEFIFRMREALEGEVTSHNLGKWIDLIFGDKQRGKKADSADNLFYFLTYEVFKF